MSKQKMTEAVIGALAIISIILLVMESLLHFSASVMLAINLADLAICIVFAGDFIIRLRASNNRLQFVKSSWYEILAMIPALALYALGSIPILAGVFRSLRLLRVIRVILLVARFGRGLSKLDKFLQRSNLLTLLAVTFSIILIGAFAVLILDHDVENAQITTFSDAVWWSLSTVTTVGYGDIVPSSAAARTMGMLLMIIGIGIMTTFISEVSATFVESRLQKDMECEDFRSAVINEIKCKLDNIDKLSDSDVSLLIRTIQTLRGKEEENV